MKQVELVKALKKLLLTATKNSYADATARAIRELKDHGDSRPSLNFTDEKRQYSPLMYACENGMTGTVGILLQSGASPGYTSKEKGSPRLNAFHVACTNGHLDIVQELLSSSATTYSFQIVHPETDKTKFGWTPVMYAIKSGSLEIAKLLGVDPKAVTKQGGQTVLHIAARGSEDRHLECLKWLCSQADSESLLATDKNGWNLLHHACAGGNAATVRWLVEQVKALPDANKFLNQVTKPNSGFTPLHVACNYQKLEVLKFLLDTEGVDCCAHTVKKGLTGLHFAALHDSAEMARLLIGKNCPLLVQDEEGNTALHIAKVKCSFEVEDILIAADLEGELSQITNKDMKTAAEIEPEVVIPPEIKKRGKEKEYMRALREGKERIPRCNLLILGEQEVGKTSLYRLITGREFLSELESTRGIDNNVVEVVDTRQLSIDSWHEVGEEERKAKDEEAYMSGVANEIGSLTATKAAKSDQPPTEEELLQWITDYVSDYKRSEDISSVQAKASSSGQPAIFHTHASSSHTPHYEKRRQQEPKVYKQQAKSMFSEAIHHPKHIKIQRPSPPPLSLPTENERESDREAIPPGSPVAVLEQHSRISRKRHLSIGKKLKTGFQKLEPELYLNAFDFAGQKEYRPMHHCFITSRAMYLVVFNLQKIIDPKESKQSLKEIRYWLYSIHAHIGQAYSDKKRVFLIGTHCSPKDEKDGHPLSQDELANVHKILYREFFAEDHHKRCVNHLCFVQGEEEEEDRIFHAVENSCDKEDEREVSGAKLLQSELKRITASLDFLQNEYPIIWLQFEEQLLHLRQKKQEQHLSQVVGYDEVIGLARKCGLNNEGGEGEEPIPERVETAIDFFHDTGTIVDLTQLPTLFVNESERSQLKGLVLLDPKWLIIVMREVIQLRHSTLCLSGEDLQYLSTKGIARASLLKKCWSSEEFRVGSDQQSFRQLCLILQAYGLIHPIEEKNEAATATPPPRSASVPAEMSQAASVPHSPSEGDVSLQPSGSSECFLVPCRLPEKAEVKQLEGITFFFDFQGFLPAEIFHRLICLMLNKSRGVQRKRNIRHMFSSTCCYFPNIDGCRWRVELDKEDCILKVTVNPRGQKREPISYLSLFHLEYLKRVCRGEKDQQGSSSEEVQLPGLVYDGGPRCPCGAVIAAVGHDDDDIPAREKECDDCLTKVNINCLLDPEYEDSTPQPSTASQPTTSLQPTIIADTVVLATGSNTTIATGPNATIKAPHQTEPDLSTVTEYLLDLDKIQVYNLGISLGLSQKRAKNMFDSANNITVFLDEIVNAWLQRVDQVDEKGGPSWKSLVAALRSKRLKHIGIANNIEKDHLV